MKKEKSELLLGFTALIYGMFLLFVLVNNFTGRTDEHWRFFYAFTNQSNIIVLIWLVVFGITCFVKSKVGDLVRNRTLMTSITVYISITFFIVVFVLNPLLGGKYQPLSSSSEFFTHNATTVIMWFMLFLVPGKGELKTKKLPFMLAYPIVYLIANLIIGATVTYKDGTAAYAYGFTDPNSYPNIFIFLLAIVALIIVFTAFSVGLIKFKKYIDTNYHELTE